MHPSEGGIPSQIVFAIVTSLHDLFTVIWVGELVTLGVVVLPESRLQRATGGRLYLAGAYLSAWQGMDLPREWEVRPRTR